MLVSLIAAATLTSAPASRVEQGFRALLRPPFSIDLTIGRGREKILWERSTVYEERFRLNYESSIVEYRGRGQEFLEIDWSAREYVVGSKMGEEFGPFGDVDPALNSAYPYICQSPNLQILMQGAKVSEPAKNVVLIHKGNEKLTVVFSAAGTITKFTQNVQTPGGLINRDWVVVSARRQAASIDLSPPNGMLPMLLSAGQWPIDPAAPLPNLTLFRDGKAVAFGSLLTKNLTIVELLGTGEKPNPALPKLASGRGLGHIVIGAGQAFADSKTVWERTYAMGGYPVVLVVDRERRAHLAFQGRMPEMITEIEEYLRAR